MNTIIIGAGAAGIMAAKFAHEAGSRVTLLEKNNRICRKVMITGKGRCNITNNCDVEDMINAVTHNSKFMYSAFYTFSNFMLMELLEENGLELKTERGARVFPKSDRAVDVVDTLYSIMKKSGAELVTGARVKEILQRDGKVTGVLLENGKILKADNVILATGGKSYPLTGSTGDGYKMAEKLGHTIIKPKASLVELVSDEISILNIKNLGLRNVGMKLLKNGKKIYEDFGEITVTDRGLDGPTIKSASCWVEDDFSDNSYSVVIDFKPALSETKLENRILREIKNMPKENMKRIVSTMLPMDLISTVMKRAGINPATVSSELTKEKRNALINAIKNYEVKIDALGDIESAIVTSGGVDVDEIDSSTMESKLVKGLYFAGEVIDVDAYTGGFNLQIAFSTGALAGMNCR